MPGSRLGYELLRARVRRFTRMLHAVEEHQARGLHRTRVASRRLREVLPVLQLEPKVARDLGRRLRKLTTRLGPLRELDVTLQLLEELRDSDRYDSDAVDRVVAETTKQHETALDALPAKWPAREIRRLGSKLIDLADRLKLAEKGSPRSRASSQGLRWAVDARINRRAGALRTAIGEAGSVYLPDRLHLVRISLKKFRYAVELASEIAGAALAPPLRKLKRNQDLLGRWHDRQVLIDRVRQLQASLTPPSVSTWRRLDSLVTALEEDCRRLHARYVRESSALVAICAGLGGRSAAARRAS